MQPNNLDHPQRDGTNTANGKGEQRIVISHVKVCLHLLAPLKFRPGRFLSAKTLTKIEHSVTYKIPANSGFCMKRPGKEKSVKKRDLFIFGVLMAPFAHQQTTTKTKKRKALL